MRCSELTPGSACPLPVSLCFSGAVGGALLLHFCVHLIEPIWGGSEPLEIEREGETDTFLFGAR